MSSTIHSFGPKPASGFSCFSCELVAWLDTASIASSTRVCLISWVGGRLQGYALIGGASAPPSGNTNVAARGRPRCPRSCSGGSGDVPPAGDQGADDAGDHAVADQHDRAD